MNDKNKYQLGIQEFNAAYVPQYQEVIKNKPWVFYGSENDFPNHLLTIYNYSPITRACANATIYGVKGKNFIVKEGDPNRIAMANRSETLYEVYEKLVVDRIIFGGFACNIVKSNDGGIAEIYHTDFSRLRAGKEDMFGNVGTYYYSVDWRGTQINPQKWKPVELPAFNMVSDEAPSQIYYAKRYSPMMSYYPPCDWIASLTTAQLDIEIRNFHLNNTQNSMMPSMSVSFTNGVPSEEERDILMRQLEAKYTSTNNAGKIFLFFSENPETQPVISPLPNNASDAWYSNMAPQIDQTCLSAWGISSPMLLGIKTEGQLGGRTEMLDAYNLFSQTRIIPIQEEILAHIQKLLFLRDKQPIHLGIEQNQILPDEEQSQVDIKEGI